MNCAMPGFGTMASCAAGELCATTAGAALPSYASGFSLNKWDNVQLMLKLQSKQRFVVSWLIKLTIIDGLSLSPPITELQSTQLRARHCREAIGDLIFCKNNCTRSCTRMTKLATFKISYFLLYN